MQLSRVELKLIEALRGGKAFSAGADLPSRGAAGRRIRAQVLRGLLCGEALGDGTPAGPPVRMLDLEGVLITGRLDLRDFRALDGDGAPPIRLRRCQLPDGLDLSFGRFASLSLLECRFTDLRAEEARFDGSVDLSGCASAETPRQASGCRRPGSEGVVEALGLCEVDLHLASIEGHLKASGAKLCCRPKHPDFDGSGGGTPYALRLNSASVRGSLVLQPDFIAHGGVDIASAEINGDVWMQGAQISAEWSDRALSATSVRIASSMALSALFRKAKPPQPFISDGEIRLYGARIAGELYMPGAKLRAPPGGYALLAYLAEIAKPVRVTIAREDEDRVSSIPFEAIGAITFECARLGGFDATGGVFDGQGRAALSFDQAVIHGNLDIGSMAGVEVLGADTSEPRKRQIIHRSLSRGPISAASASISGRLALIGVRVEVAAGAGVDLHQAQIGRTFSLTQFEGRLQFSHDGPLTALVIACEVHGGSLGLWGLKVGGQFLIQSAELGDGALAVAARALEVADDVRIEQVRCQGQLTFDSASIRHDLVLKELRITSKIAAVDLENAVIGGSVRLLDVQTNQLIFGRFARVGGELRIEGRSLAVGRALAFDSAVVRGDLRLSIAARGALVLSHIEVGGTTRLSRCAFEARATEPPSVIAASANFNGGLEVEPAAISLSCFPRASQLPLLRARELSFYPGWRLVEGLVDTDADTGVASFLWDGAERLTPLPGAMEPIRKLNRQAGSPLRLDDDTAAEYLAFAASQTWGEGGAFRVIASAADIAAHGLDPEEQAAFIGGDVRATATGWVVPALVEYDGRISRAELAVSRQGDVKMLSDQTLTTEKVLLRAYDPPLRTSGSIRDALSYRISRELDPSRPWPPGPRLRGDWRDLGSHASASVQAVRALDGALSGVRRVRVLDLSFYPGWKLAQGLVDVGDAEGLASWLWKDDEAVLLNGQSNPIHTFNLRTPPQLDSDAQAADYLRFFTLHLWGDEGPFLIIDDADELPFADKEREDRAGAIRPLRIGERGALIEAEATIAYAGHLFLSQLAIHPSGMVEMAEDTPLPIDPAQLLYEFHPPYSFARDRLAPPRFEPPPLEWPDTPALGGDWRELDTSAADRFRAAVRASHARQKCLVDLAAAHADYLDDGHGEQWGDQVALALSGFTYDQIDRGRTSNDGGEGKGGAGLVAARKAWLRRQYPDGLPKQARDFDAQPFAQLSSVYRSSGRSDESREIARDKIDLEARLRAADLRREMAASPWTIAAMAAGVAALIGGVVAWPGFLWLAGILLIGLAALWFGPALLNRAFDIGFGYGLYPANALVTFVMMLVMGWIGVAIANRQQIGPLGLADFSSFEQVMMVDVAQVTDGVVATGRPDRPLQPGVRTYKPGEVSLNPINCGDDIDPFLYAADVFVPLIDLRQEGKCSPTGGSKALYWQWAKALYAFLGWIVTSLTILTVSGVLQRRVEH